VNNGQKTLKIAGCGTNYLEAGHFTFYRVLMTLRRIGSPELSWQSLGNVPLRQLNRPEFTRLDLGRHP
jgi:hypothetical protein